MSDKNKEIEKILKLVEKKKNYHLLQTNTNERDDLSQELDLLIYEKLKVYLDNQPPQNLYQYLKENTNENK